MRFEFKLADGGELAVGVDPSPHIGFFASLRRGRKREEYDGLTEGYDRARPLAGVMAWLVARGVFSFDDLEAALLASEMDETHGLSAGERLAYDVFDALKAAARG